jgi:hypothetical protein
VLTAPSDRIVVVPAVSRFLGIVIAMFFDDHGPPHFHARHADEAPRFGSTRSSDRDDARSSPTAARARLGRTAPRRTA